ncbi:MAG: sensor histidine kinase, partial [Dehalococcoidia bacterium]|nr:sensor histidine kinase [Dehalococcoidia bacterium]
YGPDDAELATAVANQAAIALENARLFAEASTVAALEERQRLARELHDSVSQALYGIALGAQTARQLVESDPARAVDPIEYVASLAEAGLAEMRALIFELRPESLASEGIVSALEKQVAATRARYGVAVVADLPEEPDVPLRVKEALYRIAQEAMHNTIKHARASRIDIRLAASAERTQLEIRDDGSGFVADGDFPGHLGLRSMRERAEAVGGTLTIVSTPGTGTTVRADVPRQPVS